MFIRKYFIPILYLLAILIVYGFEMSNDAIKSQLAILPLDKNHLTGIFTTVFVHGSLEHLSSNFLPLSICLFGLFYFYKNIALPIVFLSHFFTGVLIWCFARNAYHIGASGLVYALIFFTLISAIIKSNKQLIIFAFVILIFQSGLVWGLVPQDNEVSWESHLFGALVGIALAFIYKKKGPSPDIKINAFKEYNEENDEYLNL